MGLTSKPTLEAVQKVFDKFFDLNSILDRDVYLLDIKFNMPKFQKYIHEEHSHKMPLLADMIQEFGSLRGDLFYRSEVPAHFEEYVKVSDMFKKYVFELSNLEDMCAEAINIAIENKDFMYEDFMRSFEVEQLAKFTKQVAVFYQAIKDYESANQIFRFNKDYESWIIDEFKGGD